MIQFDARGLLAIAAFAMCLALAFGVRDLCWGFVYGAATLGIWNDTMGIEPTDPDDPIYVIYLFGTLLAVPLIAYGILRAHLFDIDLRDSLGVAAHDAETIERDVQARA